MIDQHWSNIAHHENDQELCAQLDEWALSIPLLRDALLVLVHSLDDVLDDMDDNAFPHLDAYLQKKVLESSLSGASPQVARPKKM